jgi:Methylase involved in ubiquinone/menaquinone biosynthesis
MHSLNTVGSNLVSFECPRCGAHDRERHLLLYMQATGLLRGMRGKSVLHFAPEANLSRHFDDSNPARYVRCDLHPRSQGIQRVDLLNMEFGAQEFDVIIANHVLEHVADDKRALSEITRVLKPGGWAILQTPYSPKLHHTWQDAGIDDFPARLQAYGQEDHVRLYGRDIFERIAASGLSPDIRSHAETLPHFDPGVVGVNPDEPLFLFWRNIMTINPAVAGIRQSQTRNSSRDN